MEKEQESESAQRWTTKRKTALVLSILKGDISSQEAARQNGLTVAEIEEWKDRFLLGAENALRSRPKDEEALKDEQIKKLERKVGQLVMDIDILKAAQKLRPSTPGASEEERRWSPALHVVEFASCWMYHDRHLRKEHPGQGKRTLVTRTLNRR